MNIYDIIVIYSLISTVIAHVLVYKIIKNKLAGKKVEIPQLTPVTRQFAPQVKVDKRNKYTVNVEACERYLATRK